MGMGSSAVLAGKDRSSVKAQAMTRIIGAWCCSGVPIVRKQKKLPYRGIRETRLWQNANVLCVALSVL